MRRRDYGITTAAKNQIGIRKEIWKFGILPAGGISLFPAHILTASCQGGQCGTCGIARYCKAWYTWSCVCSGLYAGLCIAFGYAMSYPGNGYMYLEQWDAAGVGRWCGGWCYAGGGGVWWHVSELLPVGRWDDEIRYKIALKYNIYCKNKSRENNIAIDKICNIYLRLSNYCVASSISFDN